MDRKSIHKGTENLTQFLEGIENYKPEDEMTEGKKNPKPASPQKIKAITNKLKRTGIDKLIKFSLDGGMKAYTEDPSGDEEGIKTVFHMEHPEDDSELSWTVYTQDGESGIFLGWEVGGTSGNDDLEKYAINDLMERMEEHLKDMGGDDYDEEKKDDEDKEDLEEATQGLEGVEVAVEEGPDGDTIDLIFKDSTNGKEKDRIEMDLDTASDILQIFEKVFQVVKRKINNV